MPVDKFGRMSDTKTKEYHLLILIIIILEVMVVIL